MKRLSNGAIADRELNRDLANVMIGALLQRDEDGMIITPAQIQELKDLNKRVATIDPKETP